MPNLIKWKKVIKKPVNKTQSTSKNIGIINKHKKDFSEIFTDWIGSVSSLIVHTIFFIGSFLLILLWVNFNNVLLVLTTVVSLEAIYLAIFIQMTVNRNTASLKEVEKDIDEIQEDIDEIQEDVDEIQEDVDEIQEDVENIEKDIDEIQEEDGQEEIIEDKTIKYIEKIEWQMQVLVREIAELKKYKK